MPISPGSPAAPDTAPRSVRQHRAARRTAAAAAVPQLLRSLSILFVVRESDRNAYREMAKMFRQVLARFAHMPEVARMMAVGVDIVRPGPLGDAARAMGGATALFAPNGVQVGWLVVIGDVGFIFAMQSAASTNLQGSNDFCDALAGVVDQYCPARIATGPMNRICRIKDHADIVRDAGWRTRAVVEVVGEEPIDLADPAGRERWDVLAWQCEGEYRGITSRLVNGELDLLHDGLWPKSADAAGYGYVADEAGPAGLAFDPACFETWWTMVQLGADEAMSDAAIAAALGEIGMSSATLVAHHGPGATVADANAAAAMASRWRWLPTYRHGTYRYSREVGVNPRYLRWDFVLTDIDGGELPEDNWSRPAQERVPAHMIRTLSLGRVRRHLADGVRVPEGLTAVPGRPGVYEGLTQAEVVALDGCITNRLTERSPGPARELRSPFGGLSSIGDGFVDRLVADGDAYCVRRIPKAQAETRRRSGLRRGLTATLAAEGLAAQGGMEGAVVGRVGAVALHNDIVRACVERLSAVGLSVEELFPAAATTPVSGRQVLLQAELTAREAAWTEATQEAAGYRKMAARAHGSGDTKAGDEMEAEGAGAAALAENLSAEISSLRDQLAGAAVAPTIEHGPLVILLSFLAETGRFTFPPAAVAQLRQLISELVLTTSADGQTVSWEAVLHVRTSVGMRALPIGGSLTTAAYAITGADGRIIDVRSARGDAAARGFLVEGRPLAEVAAELGLDEATTRRKASAWLRPHVPSKGHRAAILDGPGPLRRVLGAWVAAQRSDEPFVCPPDLPADTAAHLIETYSADVPWPMAWCGDTHILARVAIGYLAPADAERGMLVADLLDRLRISIRDLLPLLDARQSGDAPPYPGVLERVPWRDSAGVAHTGWRGAPTEAMRVRLRRCDHCGTRSATRPLRTPCVTEGVLCATCGRQPGHPEAFPAEWLEDHVGPRGRDGNFGPGTRIIPTPSLREWRRQRGVAPKAGAGRVRINIDRETLVRLYVAERLSQVEVGRRLGISKPSVLDQLRRHDIPTRQGGYISTAFTPTIDRKALVRLYVDGGLPLAAVAAEVGATTRLVRAHLAHHRIPVRAHTTPATRPAGRPFRVVLDEALLRRQYVDEGRSVAAVAAANGISSERLLNHLRHYGIPVRARRGGRAGKPC